MKQPADAWRDYGLPVLVAMLVFSFANYLINYHFRGVPHSVPVYLIGGCLVSLLLLVRAFRRKSLTLRDVGMAPAGWKPQYRLLGIVVVCAFSGGFYSTLDKYAERDKVPAELLLQEIADTREQIEKRLDESTAVADGERKDKIKQLVLAQVDDLQRTLTDAPANDAQHLAAAVAATRKAIYEQLHKEIVPLYLDSENDKTKREQATQLSKVRAVVANATDLVERSLRGKTPDFGDYFFWFVWLLPASLAELSVFGLIGFCLSEQWLRGRGMHPIVATGLAIAFGAVTFGVYHYTHEPRWWSYAIIPLVPVMFVNLTMLAVTRNFQLTLLLHNSFAAVGFTGEQFIARDAEAFVDPQHYPGGQLALSVVVFVIAYLALHVLEWRFWPGNKREEVESPVRKQEELATAE